MSRAKENKADEAANVTAAPFATTVAAGPVSDTDYRVALDKAAKGDTEAMGLVRRAFDEKPGRWRNQGDMAFAARTLLAEAAAGKDDLPVIEVGLRTMAAKEAEIAQPAASALEKLLAARIAITWFEMCQMDAIVAYNRIKGVRGKALDTLDARRDRADRRFRHAIRDLATVRRLLRPSSAVQVNAGVAQVNVGGTAATTTAR